MHSSFLKSEFLAEEITQEVFLELWDHRKELLEIENPAAWMYRMVSNKCINLLKRKERETEREIELVVVKDLPKSDL